MLGVVSSVCKSLHVLYWLRSIRKSGFRVWKRISLLRNPFSWWMSIKKSKSGFHGFPFTVRLGICKTILVNSGLHFKSRLSLIVRVNVVLNRTVVVDSDWRFDNLCGSHLQSQSECITSVDGIILWLLIWLVNYVAMLLVVCQLSRDVIGYEDS